MHRAQWIRGLAALAVFALLGQTAAGQRQAKGVRLSPRLAERRVDVFIDGQPFTSYLWPAEVMKPVLYPLRTAQGAVVTRGFPLTPRPNERVDHPHQAGLWFNYGDVNGLDFWNNSPARSAEEKKKMGSIVHQRVVVARGGLQQGELEVEAHWVAPDGSVLLVERTKFIFRGGPDFRSVDRMTTLTAGADRVLFKDNKEGLFGMRVTRELESPASRPEVLTDAGGKAGATPRLDNTGVSGVYLTSEGKQGDAAWGTTARWCMLAGNIGQEPVTLLILDNPKNPGHPAYWHARGYGLFAANPLGRAAFSNGKDSLNYALEPKQSVTFRYRLLIRSEIMSAEAAEAAYREFAGPGR